MKHKSRIIKESIKDMHSFICGESKPPEAFERFFKKVFRKIYDKAYLKGFNDARKEFEE